MAGFLKLYGLSIVAAHLAVVIEEMGRPRRNTLAAR